MVDQAARDVRGTPEGLAQRQAARLEFWQSFWFPLVAYVACYFYGAGWATTLFTWFVWFIVPAFVACHAFGLVELADQCRNWMQYGVMIGCVPSIISKYPTKIAEYIGQDSFELWSNWFADAGPVTAWQSLLLPAALTFVIPLYLAFSRRGIAREKKFFDVAKCFFAFMFVTVIVVQCFASSGLVEFDTIILLSKTTALVSIILAYLDLFILPKYCTVPQATYVFYVFLSLANMIALYGACDRWIPRIPSDTMNGWLDSVSIPVIVFNAICSVLSLLIH